MNGGINLKYAVEITNLTKSYGDIKPLDNLSLEIPVGSVFGYLGPNGAGKTTTMKILAGLLHYPEGSVKIFGEEVKTSPSNSKTTQPLSSDISAWRILGITLNC